MPDPAAPANAPATPAQPAAGAPAPAAAAAQPPAQQPPAAAQPAAPALPSALAAMLGGAAAPAQQAAADAPKPPAEAAQQPPKPADAPKADESVAALRAQINATAIRDAVKAVAVEAGAIAPDQVVKLFGDELDVDTSGRVFVKSDPRADVKRYLAQQLAANLHLLKPVVAAGGAGSPGTVQAPGAAQQFPVHSREGGTQVAHNFLSRLFPAPASAPAAGGAATPR